jgi:hypothetical protein
LAGETQLWEGFSLGGERSVWGHCEGWLGK